MRLSEMADKCEDCKWPKILGLDMSGDHQMMCHIKKGLVFVGRKPKFIRNKIYR